MISKRDRFFNKVLVLDTETTSKDYKTAEVVELGLAWLENSENWVTYSELFKPATPILPECSAVTNISNKMLFNKPSFAERISEGIYDLDMSKIIVAHNAFYDLSVLGRYGVGCFESLCTLALARKVYFADSQITAHNLPYLRFALGILDPADNPNIAAHRASFDALVTGHLLVHLIDVLEDREEIGEEYEGDYLHQLHQFINRPRFVEKMPFGKHKGELLTDIPMNYWKWAIANMDAFNEDSDRFDSDLAHSVMSIIENKI